jgi:hypothetical protein
MIQLKNSLRTYCLNNHLMLNSQIKFRFNKTKKNLKNSVISEVLAQTSFHNLIKKLFKKRMIK